MLSVAIRHRLGDFRLDAHFEAGPGVTAIFGRSGAGKTSIVNAVAGLLRPETGRIVLDGRSLFDADRRVFLPPDRRRLGYVFQDGRLFPHLSVEENLRYGRRFAPDPMPEAELRRLVSLLGLDDLLGRRPAGLSGGERSRVALGRALLSSPRMLLLDEPLSALDAPRKQDILPYLERLAREAGVPMLYVSHDMSEIARLADHLVLVHAGKVVRHGPLREVLSDPAAVPLVGPREAGAVLDATVVAHEADGLTRLRVSGGELFLPGVRAAPGARLRLRVLAQDVILSHAAPQGLSSLNALPARIEAIHSGAGPGAAVALRVGEDRLLARIPARAVADPGFAVDDSVYVILQPTSVARGDIGRE